jgi:hypothetical protein
VRWRVAIAVLLALAVGIAGGWAYAGAQDDGDDDTGPVAAAIQPVPAEPSVPVRVAQPDPDDPALETGIALDDTRLTLPAEDGTDYQVELPVPFGWLVTPVDASMWKYTVAGNSENAYGLRVQIIADQGKGVSAAVQARIAGLRSAVLQDNMSDLEVEETGSGFTATYLDEGGFSRVSIERFYEGRDGTAFATVAAYGRIRDRRGLEDLIERITTGLSTRQAG